MKRPTIQVPTKFGLETIDRCKECPNAQMGKPWKCLLTEKKIPVNNIPDHCPFLEPKSFVGQFAEAARVLRDRYQERTDRTRKIQDLAKQVRKGELTSEEAEKQVKVLQLQVTNFEDPLLDLFAVLSAYEKSQGK